MNDLDRKSAEDEYFKAAASWDEDRRHQDRMAVKRYKAVAISAVGFAAIMGLALTALLPFKQFVPAVIRVDNATGAYDVKVAGESLDAGDKRNEKIIISDVTRYIKAREGFTRGEAEENYKTVYLMSCGLQRAEWDNYINPQLNKNSPVVMLTNQDADRVTVQSVTFLQSLDEDSRTAQVQFEKTVMRGSTPPLRFRFVSTLRVRYDQKNVPNNQLNYYLNPFGFCVDDYRRDPVGNPSVVNAPGSPGQELNQVMENFRKETDAALAAVRAQQQLQAIQAAAAAQAASAPAPGATGGFEPTLSNIGMGATAPPTVATPAPEAPGGGAPGGPAAQVKPRGK